MTKTTKQIGCVVGICTVLAASAYGLYGIRQEQEKAPLFTASLINEASLDFVENNSRSLREILHREQDQETTEDTEPEQFEGASTEEENLEEEAAIVEEEPVDPPDEKEEVVELVPPVETEPPKTPEVTIPTVPGTPAPGSVGEPPVVVVPEPPVAEAPVQGEPINRGDADREKLMNQDLNSYVLEVLSTYTIGNYPYLLNNDYANYNGVTTNLVYKDQVLLKAHPSGNKASQCVGITFEVFFKAMQARNEKLGLPKDDFNGMNWNDLYNMALNWFVASGSKSQSNAAFAIEQYGLGKRIYNLEEAKAGDFIDISRENNTGHTVVLINWIRDNGQIVGLKYWSSQESTKGIAYKEEYFNIAKPDGSKYGNIILDMLYIGRVTSVNLYQ